MVQLLSQSPQQHPETCALRCQLAAFVARHADPRGASLFAHPTATVRHVLCARHQPHSCVTNALTTHALRPPSPSLLSSWAAAASPSSGVAAAAASASAVTAATGASGSSVLPCCTSAGVSSGLPVASAAPTSVSSALGAVHVAAASGSRSCHAWSGPANSEKSTVPSLLTSMTEITCCATAAGKPEVPVASRSAFTQYYGPPVDLWSVGCILAEVLLRRPLFQGKDYMHQLEEIIGVLGTPNDESLAFITNSMAKRAIIQLPRRQRRPFSELFRGCNEQAVGLLERMLVFDPRERCTVDEALSHPYFKPLHDANEEPVCKIPFDVQIERDYHGREVPKAVIQNEVYRDMLRFHPEERGCCSETRESSEGDAGSGRRNQGGFTGGRK